MVFSVLILPVLSTLANIGYVLSKAVNRGDERTRRVRDRDFVKFERSRRYRDRYRCQEKKPRRGRARDPVFRDPPTPRTSPRSLFADRDPPPCYDGGSVAMDPVIEGDHLCNKKPAILPFT